MKMHHYFIIALVLAIAVYYANSKGLIHIPNLGSTPSPSSQV